MAPAIKIDQLSKRYKLPGSQGWKCAVDGLDLEVTTGEVFAFLGANGAGKTTTIKVLLNFLKPTSGGAEIFGIPVSSPKARQHVGYLPEQPYFHKFLTPMEVLGMHAALIGIPRRERKAAGCEVLEITGLTDYVNTPIGKLSKGLTQRVGIAQALVGDPKLLILDEPASGLDPIGRRHIRDLLTELRGSGKTIFLSSHLLSEIETVCDRIAILNQGKLVAAGTPDSVKQSEPYMAVNTSEIPSEAKAVISRLGGQVRTTADGCTIRIETEQIFALLRVLEQYGIPPTSVNPARESLEEAFLRLAA